MSEWLLTNSPDWQISLATLSQRLLLAWLCGWIVAWVARRKLAAGATDTLTLTLVLMCILIAMATQIIGDNIARAFSLVGALSIVRFRTAVPATRDVAFVLAAVVVGMAIGAGQYWVVVIGLIVVALATHFNTSPQPSDQLPTRNTDVWRLSLTVGLHNSGGWEAELVRLTESFQLVSAETVRRGGAIELVYRYQPRAGFDASQLIAALNAIPHVESASAKMGT